MDIEKELSEIKALVKDNNRLLVSIHRRAKLSMFFVVLKWAIIIAVTLGAFYYVQPIFEAILKTYASVGGLGSGPNGESLLELWKSF